MNLLREEAEEIEVPQVTAVSPDPADDPICACAEHGEADFVVTLNKRDFPQERLSAGVIAPDEPLPLGGGESGDANTAWIASGLPAGAVGARRTRSTQIGWLKAAGLKRIGMPPLVLHAPRAAVASSST